MQNSFGEPKWSFPEVTGLRLRGDGSGELQHLENRGETARPYREAHAPEKRMFEENKRLTAKKMVLTEHSRSRKPKVAENYFNCFTI